MRTELLTQHILAKELDAKTTKLNKQCHNNAAKSVGIETIDLDNLQEYVISTTQKDDKTLISITNIY